MILYINACTRSDSRTDRLARHLLENLGGDAVEHKLDAFSFPPVNEAFLSWRDSCSASGDFSSPVFGPAKEFAEADAVVIAAPFWDLSFPSVLKQYLEQITVLGLMFCYTEEGIPKGLCKARRLYYVTTAGGPVFSSEYGFGYVRALAGSYYGIPNAELILAEGLDLQGADVESILRAAEQEIDKLFSENAG